MSDSKRENCNHGHRAVIAAVCKQGMHVGYITMGRKQIRKPNTERNLCRFIELKSATLPLIITLVRGTYMYYAASDILSHTGSSPVYEIRVTFISNSNMWLCDSNCIITP